MKQLFTLAFLLMSYCMSIAQENCNNYWPAISPDGMYIYFSSDRHGGDYEIYRTDIDGTSNLIRLTNSSGNKLYPSVSPDGSLIAFQHGDYDFSAEVYVMNNDGSNLTQLTNNNIYDGYPNFSPDGSKIVFDAWDSSQYPEIFTMNIDGSDRTQLTNEPGVFWQSVPIYNPSGTKIYFCEGLNADNHFVMMDLDGSNWVNITEPNVFGDSDWALDFNSDGSKIVFFTTQWLGYNNGSDIVIADPDGSNWNKITDATNGEYFYCAFFHPSNSKIYYSYLPGVPGKFSTYTMNLDGSDSKKISNCSALGVNEEYDNPKTLIFPNPSNGIIRVNFDDEFILEIYDITGRLLLKASTKQINITHLNTGVYPVLLKDADGKLVKSEKLLKY